ncbi:hypothetical protein VM98_37235, partial [Streptomyces rubellomurinus subsp. indigoferus]
VGVGADGGDETGAVAGQEHALGQLPERPVAGEGQGVLAQVGQAQAVGPGEAVSGGQGGAEALLGEPADVQLVVARGLAYHRDFHGAHTNDLSQHVGGCLPQVQPQTRP